MSEQDAEVGLVVRPHRLAHVDVFDLLELGEPPRAQLTADTALRLARYFGTTEMFWLNLQTRYDLETAKNRLGKRLQREVTRRAATE